VCPWRDVPGRQVPTLDAGPILGTIHEFDLPGSYRMESESPGGMGSSCWIKPHAICIIPSEHQTQKSVLHIITSLYISWRHEAR